MKVFLKTFRCGTEGCIKPLELISVSTSFEESSNRHIAVLHGVCKEHEKVVNIHCTMEHVEINSSGGEDFSLVMQWLEEEKELLKQSGLLDEDENKIIL